MASDSEQPQSGTIPRFDAALRSVLDEVLAGGSVLVVGANGTGKSAFLDEMSRELVSCRRFRVHRRWPGGAVDPVVPGPTTEEHEDVWIVDDFDRLDFDAAEEVLDRLRLTIGRTVVALSVDAMQRPSRERARDDRVERVLALWRGSRVRRQDLPLLGDREAMRIIAELPDAPAVNTAARWVAAVNAAGMPKLLAPLIARSRHFIEQQGQTGSLWRTAQPGHALVDLVRPYLDRMSEQERRVLLAIARIGGLRQQELRRLVDSDVLDALVERGWVVVTVVGQRVYANRLFAAAAEDLVDRDEFEAWYRDVVTRNFAGESYGTWPAALALVGKWAGGKESIPPRDSLDKATRQRHVALAVEALIKNAHTGIALEWAQLDLDEDPIPEHAVQYLRAAFANGRADLAERFLRGYDVTRIGPELAPQILAASILEASWAPSMYQLAVAVAAKAGMSRDAIRDWERPQTAARRPFELDWRGALEDARGNFGTVAGLSDRVRSALLGAIAAGHLGDLEEVRRWLDELRELGRNVVTGELFSASAEGWSLFIEGYLQALTGYADHAFERRLEHFARLAAESGSHALLAMLNLASGTHAFALGDWRTALVDLRAGLARTEAQKIGRWFPFVESRYLDALLLTGDVDGAEAELDTYLRRGSQLGAQHRYTEAVTRTKIAQARGDVVGALAWNAQAIELGAASAPLYELRDRFREWRLGGDTAALDRVRALAAGCALPVAQQYLRYLDAVAEGREGEPQPADAVATAGFARVVATASSSVLPLTDRELEIAALIGQGLSNRQIADQLFLSVRTVESHIYSARSKVGAASRGQLAEFVTTDRAGAERATLPAAQRRSA